MAFNLKEIKESRKVVKPNTGATLSLEGADNVNISVSNGNSYKDINIQKIQNGYVVGEYSSNNNEFGGKSSKYFVEDLPEIDLTTLES